MSSLPSSSHTLLASLRAVFSGRMVSDPAEMAPWLRDYRQRWGGPALAVVQPALALLLGGVPGLGWLARLPLSAFGDSAHLLSGAGIELNLGHYGLLPIAESLVVLLIYLNRLKGSAAVRR